MLCLVLCFVYNGHDWRDIFEAVRRGDEISGVNQSIDMRGVQEELRVNQTASVVISNFTLTGGRGVVFHVCGGMLELRNITFVRVLDFSMEFVGVNVVLRQCQFVNLPVKSCNLLSVNRSTVTFENTKFDAVTQVPGSNVVIVDIIDSDVKWKGCEIMNLYHGHSFTRLVNTTLSVMESSFSSNSGHFIFESHSSEIAVKQCKFEANSCPLIALNESRCHIDMISIHANCIKNPILSVFNDSVLEMETSELSDVSCGAILSSNSSTVNIKNTTVVRIISPNNSFSFWRSQISFSYAAFVNITAVNGSVVSATDSLILVSCSNFTTVNSRGFGTVVYAENSRLDASNLTISESHAKSDGAGLFLSNCSSDFAISNSFFINNSGTNIASIMTLNCSGDVENSVFTGVIQREVSVPLFSRCRNCSFAVDEEIKTVELIHTPTKPSNVLAYVFVVLAVMFGVMIVFRRRLIRRVFRFRSDFNRHV